MSGAQFLLHELEPSTEDTTTNKFLRNKTHLSQDTNSFAESSSVDSRVILVTASYDHTIRFWDVLKGVCQSTLQYTESQVNQMTLSRDKRTLAVAGNPQVKIFDTACTISTPLHVYEGHRDNVVAVGFHQDGRWMFSASEDGTMRIWDLRTSQCQREFHNVGTGHNHPHHPLHYYPGKGRPLTSCQLHPNQGELISGDMDGMLRVWDISSRSCVQELCHHLNSDRPKPVKSVSINTSGTLLSSADHAGLVNVWTCIGNHVDGAYGSTKALQEAGTKLSSIHPPYSLLASWKAHDNFITKCLFGHNFAHDPLYLGREREEFLNEDTHGDVVDDEDMLAKSSNELLATASADHTVRIWDIDQDKFMTQRETTNLASSTSSTASSSSVPEIMGNFNPIQVLEGHSKWVWDAAFSADNAYLATASSDCTARLWDIATGEVINVFSGHQKAISAMAMNDFAIVQ